MNEIRLMQLFGDVVEFVWSSPPLGCCRVSGRVPHIADGSALWIGDSACLAGATVVRRQKKRVAMLSL